MGRTTVLKLLFLLALVLINKGANAQIADNLNYSQVPSSVGAAFRDNINEYNLLQNELVNYSPESGEFQRVLTRMNQLEETNRQIYEIANEYPMQTSGGNLSGGDLAEYNQNRMVYIQSQYDLLTNDNQDLSRQADEAQERLNELSSQNSGSNSLNLSDYDDGGFTNKTSDDGGEGWFVSSFISTLKFHAYNFVVVIVYEDLAAQTHSIFVVFAGVWLIWVIIGFFFMGMQWNPATLLLQFFLIMVASTILTNGGSGLFINYFYMPLISTFFGLSDFFMLKATAIGDEGVSFEGAVKRLEQLLIIAFDVANYITENVDHSWYDIVTPIKAMAVAAIFLIAIFALIFLFAAYWGYAIFALHVLLALTPIMVMLAVFKATRQYAFKWFSGIINYLAIPVVLSISMGITLTMFDGFIDEFNNGTAANITGGSNIIGEADLDSFWNIFFISVLSFLVHLRVGEIAAFLTGGVSSGLSSSWSLGIMAAAKTWDSTRSMDNYGGKLKEARQLNNLKNSE